MRVWLARVFIGLAFCLLLAHNLIVHHHDEEAIEFVSGDHDHDHDREHTASPFDNIRLEGNIFQKLDFQDTSSIVFVPANLQVVEYCFVQAPVALIKQHVSPPPEYPPIRSDVDTSELRGPPVYC